MSGFTKLFSSLVHSTVWREDMHVKVVWITMLALADRNGEVQVSLPGLADASRVTIEQCQEAIARLSSPDQFSRTKANEGRRIEEIDGGWAVLNYLKYREQRSADERRLQNRDNVARHRAAKRAAVTNVSSVSHGKPKQMQKQRQIKDQDQPASRAVEYHPIEYTEANTKALHLLAREVVSEHGVTDECEELKRRAAKAGLPYDSTHIAKAVTSAMVWRSSLVSARH